MLEMFVTLIALMYLPVTLVVIIFYTFVYECRHPFVRFIKMIVSELPVAQLSQDEHFHEYKDNASRRFSLLYLPMWSYKLYFLTWTSADGLKLVKALSFDKKYEEAEKSLEARLSRITSASWEKVRCKPIEKHLAMLQDRCMGFREAKNTAKLKGAFYITIVAAILSAFIGKIFDIRCIASFGIVVQFIVMLLFLYFANITVLLLNFMGVKPYTTMKYSSFRDRYSDDSQAIYEYWYHNFQRLEIYSRRDVDYILNVEKYIKLLFFWFVVLGIILFFSDHQEVLSCLNAHS